MYDINMSELLGNEVSRVPTDSKGDDVLHARNGSVLQYLDENDTFIAAIFENMNANRLKECVQ